MLFLLKIFQKLFLSRNPPKVSFKNPMNALEVLSRDSPGIPGEIHLIGFLAFRLN